MHRTPVLKVSSSLRPGTFLRCLLFLGNCMTLNFEVSLRPPSGTQSGSDELLTQTR